MSDDEARELNLFREVQKYPLTFAIGAPIVGTILEVWIWRTLFRIPEGTAIRPMMQSMQSWIVDIGTLLVGSVASFELVLTHKRKLMGCTLGILSLAPFLVGILFVRWICSLRHLTWAP